MWEGLVRAPQGRISLRKFIALFVTLFVAVFVYTQATSPTTYALDHDANWNGGNISYDARDYTGPTTAEKNDKSTLPEGTIYYATYDNGNARTGSQAQGYIIYFDKGTDPAKATSAHYVFGFFDVASGKFSNLSPPKEIDVDASTYGNTETIEPSSCDVSGIGWVVCPVSNWIAEGMDYLYGLLSAYLTVTPITGGDNGLYEMWNVVRNIANICFIIAFLILIYAQVTGAVMSNYTLKKMLPRILIAAILVNVSYWICAIAVDLSNVLGAAVQNMFMGMQERIGAANSGADDIGWVKVTGLALGGGSLAAIGLLGATGGGAGALAFAIIAALVPALFAVFVAVVILAARQALITVLIVLAPLAFVAYLLPNTEDWFKRWRKLFTALMVMFPAFAVIFGGAQLTGVLIIQNASTLPVVILGLLVQVIPLFITPFLIKLSSGLMGTIAGMANDRSKGVFDRAQNWAKGNQEYHKARAVNRGLRPRSRTTGIRPLTSVGARVAMSGKNREAKTQALMSGAEGLYSSRTRKGRRTAHLQHVGKQYQSHGEHRNEEHFQDYLAGNNLNNGLGRLGFVENRRSGQAAALRHLAHESHRAHLDAEALKGELDAEGNAHYEAHIERATIGDRTRAGRIREARVNTANLQGQAEVSKAVIEKQGQELLKRTVANSDDLMRQVTQAHQFEKTAEQYDSLVKKAAEEAYDNYSYTNPEAQGLRLRAIEQVDKAKVAEQQWNTFVKDVQRQGSSATGVTQNTTQIAEAVKSTSLQQHAAQQQFTASETALTTYIEELKTEEGAQQHGMLDDTAVIQLREAATQQRAQNQRSANAQGVTNLEYAKKITSDSNLADLAGGIDNYGAKRAVSAATKAIIEDFGKNVDSEKTTMSKLSDDELYNIATDTSLSSERRAAAAGKIMSNGSMRSIHRLVETMQQAQPVDSDERSAVRDIQMQMFDDMNRTPFGMGDTDKSALRRGELGQDTLAVDTDGKTILDSRGNPIITAVDDRTLDEMFASRVQNKMSGDAWISMDPDDRSRLVGLTQTAQGRALLGDQGLANLMMAFDEINNTPEMRGRLKTDGKRAANAIATHFNRPEPFNLS